MPVDALMVNAASSLAPGTSEYVTVPPAGSAAAAVYTAVLAATPSLIAVATLPELITGGRSLMERVTVCVEA